MLNHWNKSVERLSTHNPVHSSALFRNINPVRKNVMRMWRFNSKVTPLQAVAGHLLDAVYQTLPRSEGV
eukprot:SAG22_NODE_8115_length_681_cov_118.898625_1_plen_68_part_10